MTVWVEGFISLVTYYAFFLEYNNWLACRMSMYMWPPDLLQPRMAVPRLLHEQVIDFPYETP